MPRIVGGKAKGRIIKSPPGKVRPATARTRKALFDYLAGFTPGAYVLDLYCGSGGLGLEALSRGAAEVWFVDLSARSIDVAKENARILDMYNQSHFIRKDVFRFLRQLPEIISDSFDLIFAAPPYRIAEPQKILDTISASHAIRNGSAVCLEYSRHTEAPVSDKFELNRQKIYGETVVDVWEFVGDE